MATIRFLAPDTDAYVSSVQRHIGEFEARSGHRADLRIIGSDEYFSNRIEPYLAGEDAADVYMSGPVLLWEQMASGLVEPLDDYVASAGAEYRFDDFIDGLIRANRWSGRFGDPLGNGPLLEIPVNCESYNLVYVPSILERCGVEVPSTWEEYFAAAGKISANAGSGVRGFGQRGVQVWHTVYTGFATQLWSCGAADFDRSRRCAIASPEAVEATEAFIRSLKRAGPRDWTNQRWYELALDCANGKYGLLVDSDHYVAFFENPEFSSLVGRVGYALPPAGPSGLRKPNLWTWSVVMNSRSRNKRAAWDFVEWATGREFLLRSVFEGNMNPTRLSIWDDPEFIRYTSTWGNFYDVSRRLVEELGSVLVTPVTNYLQVADRWTRALRDAYLGVDPVRGALQKAASDIDAMVAG
ncbi:ABC transporter substrate-binding protein [Salinispira pacifica]